MVGFLFEVFVFLFPPRFVTQPSAQQVNSFAIKLFRGRGKGAGQGAGQGAGLGGGGAGGGVVDAGPKTKFFFSISFFGNAGNLTNRKNQRGNLLVKGFFLFAVVFF